MAKAAAAAAAAEAAKAAKAAPAKSKKAAPADKPTGKPASSTSKAARAAPSKPTPASQVQAASKAKKAGATKAAPAPAPEPAEKPKSAKPTRKGSAVKVTDVDTPLKDPTGATEAKRQSKRKADKALDAKGNPASVLSSPSQARASAMRVSEEADDAAKELTSKAKDGKASTKKAAGKKQADSKKRARDDEAEQEVQQKPAKGKKALAAAKSSAEDAEPEAAPAPKKSALKDGEASAAAPAPSTRKTKNKGGAFGKTGPSPLVAAAPAASDDEEVAEQADAAEASLLRGLDSDEDAEDGADSSDEEDEDDDEVGRHAPIEAAKLPSSRDEKSVRLRLDRAAKKHKEGEAPGVLYIGRIPHGFYETEMREYLSQFGTVSRLRLSRNRRTGKAKHYGFVEFVSAEVAKIVQETMNNYLLEGHLLQVREVPQEKIHPQLWVGANRTYRPVPVDRLERVAHDKPKTPEQQAKIEAALLARQEKRRQRIKESGIDYDFEGYTR